TDPLAADAAHRPSMLGSSDNGFVRVWLPPLVTRSYVRLIGFDPRWADTCLADGCAPPARVGRVPRRRKPRFAQRAAALPNHAKPSSARLTRPACANAQPAPPSSAARGLTTSAGACLSLGLSRRTTQRCDQRGEVQSCRTRDVVLLVGGA